MANLQANGEELSHVVAVSCGSSHSVALLSCDVVASWGRGEDGQLGHGTAEEIMEPKAITALISAGITSICCGAEYTLAVSASRKVVYSWGWGDFGRLGHGDCSDVFVPRPISFFTGVTIKHVAAGDTHTLVVTGDGKLFSFGRNQNGQLGLGHNDDILSPELVMALQDENVISIACGSEHSVAATERGEVFAWGWGRYGNLGNGSCEDRHLPTKVLGIEGVRPAHVNCGWRHSAIVTDEGRCYTFGWSKYGQLGHGDFVDCLTPKRVEALAHVRVVTIAGGWRQTIAADDQGNLYAWGWNKFGQLGLGDTEDRNTPTVVEKLQGQQVQLLASGWRHTIAVTSAGQIYSWGRGTSGQLGHGTEEDRYEPTRLPILSQGTLTKETILATSTAPAAGVGASDRYAVVPDNEVPDAFGAVPTVPGAEVPSMKKARTSGSSPHNVLA